MSDRWYSAIRAMLAERGVRLDEQGRYSIDPSYIGNDAPAQAQIEYMNDRQTLLSVRPRVMLSWTEHFSHTIKRMLSGDSTDPDALRVAFFLRLHGLVVDFKALHSSGVEALKSGAGETGSLLHHLQNVLGAIDEVVGELSEDEQLYAEYRRHVDSHIWQGAYDVQWNKREGRPRNQFTSRYTGKTYDIGDLNDRIANVLRRYGSEQAIADDFARRLAPHVLGLLSAMLRFCS